MSFILFSCGLFAQGEQGVSISENSTPPHESAMLHIFSNDKGFKIPTVDLGVNLTDIIGIIDGDIAIDGLMIYNNGPNQDKGFYYWNDVLKTWVKVGDYCSPNSCVDEEWKVIGETGLLINGESIPAFKIDNTISGIEHFVTQNSVYTNTSILGINVSSMNLPLLSIRKTCNGYIHISGYVYRPSFTNDVGAFLANYCFIDLPIGYRPINNFVVEPVISNCDLYIKSEANSLCISTDGVCNVMTGGQFMYLDFKYLAQ